MRETDIQSIGNNEIIPQPTSQKAPKGSKRVMRASITSPVCKLLILWRIQSICASLREHITKGSPFSVSSMAVIFTQTGFPTRDIMAISFSGKPFCV